MARYNLPQYQSVYRDPGSIQVNTMLRDRFANAMVADDALTASVDGMQSADYDGDNQLKNELAEEYNAKLEERSRRGDYETAGMSITKDSRGFLKSYQPIQENFGRVQAYQAKIKAEYDNKDINSETYKNLMAMSNKDYTGLQKNDDGTINEDSYFSGYSTVRDVDISERIKEGMEGYKARKGASEIQLVGQGANRDMMIKEGSTWSVVPPEDVDAIFNDVLADPDVAASLSQQADVRTYNLTDEQISTSIGNSLYGDPENEGSEGLIAQYDELVASGKEDKETVAMMDQLEDLIEEREGLLGEAGVESSEELINKRRAYMKNEVIGNEIGRERGAAYAKYVRNDVESSYIEDYDAKSLINYRIKQENYIADIQVNRGMTQVKNPGGSNLTDINSFISTQNTSLDQIAITATEDAIKAGHMEKGDPPITLEQIMSGDLPEGMSDDVKQAYKNNAVTIQTQIAIQRNLLDQAADEVGGNTEVITDKINNVSLTAHFNGDSKKSTGNITGEEFLRQAQEITGNPNLTYEAISSIFKDANSSYMSERMHRGIGFKEGDYGYETAALFLQLTKVAGRRALSKLVRKTNGELSESKDKINQYLKTNSTREVGGMSSPIMPGVDSDEAQKNSKAVKDTFVKKPLPSDFNIFYNGSKQDGTGTVESLIADLGWKGSDVIVTDVMFDTSPFMGEPTTAFTVKGVDKDDNVVYETVTVPYSNFKQSGLDKFFNTPDYRQASEVNLSRHAGLEGTTIQYDNGVSLYYDFKEGGKSSQDLITYTYTDKATNKLINKTITPLETIMIDGVNKNYLSLIINEAANKNLTYKTIKNK